MVFVAAALAAGPAQAAERYVSTGGGGAACTQPSPCSIVTGINAANPSDEVIIASGTYTTSTPLSNSSSSLSVHGVAGQSRPIINTSASSALTLNGNSGTVRDLTINHSGTGFGLFTAFDSVVDRLDVRSAGAACAPVGSTIRDTVCASTGSSGNGIFLSTTGSPINIRLRNVTVIGEAPVGPMSMIAASNTANISVDGRNVIFEGQGAGSDLGATTTVAGGSVTLTLQSSNYSSIGASGPGTETFTPAGSGGDQTAPPLFASTATYEQASGSPTIDAGSTDAFTGTTTDLNGEARVQGAAIDIGAYESTGRAAAPRRHHPARDHIDKGPKKKSKSKKAKFTFSSTRPDRPSSARSTRSPRHPAPRR